MSLKPKEDGVESASDPSSTINEAPTRIQVKSDIPHYVRHVRPDDIDEITDVAVRTNIVSPSWRYCFPYSKQYPEDHYEYSRMGFKNYIAGANSKPAMFHFVVVEQPQNQSDDLDNGNNNVQNQSTKMKIVAFAIWQLPYTYSRMNLDLTLSHPNIEKHSKTKLG